MGWKSGYLKWGGDWVEKFLDGIMGELREFRGDRFRTEGRGGWKAEK